MVPGDAEVVVVTAPLGDQQFLLLARPNQPRDVVRCTTQLPPWTVPEVRVCEVLEEKLVALGVELTRNVVEQEDRQKPSTSKLPGSPP